LVFKKAVELLRMCGEQKQDGGVFVWAPQLKRWLKLLRKGLKAKIFIVISQRIK